MKKYISIAFSLVLLCSHHAFSHGDHDHDPISESQAVLLAADVAKKLSEKDVGLNIGKLPDSWKSIPDDGVLMHKKGKGYYIVSVENKEEKKSLYVLMSSDGEVYDANFSGIFEGLE